MVSSGPDPVRHLLMTTDAAGGVWTYSIELSRALARRGVSTTLATMGSLPNPSQHDECSSIDGLELVTSEFLLEWEPDPWEDVARAGDWLLELSERSRPDVVHLNGYVHASLPWRKPVISVAHSCVLSWWRAVHGCAAPPEWERYRSAVAEGLEAATRVIAPSRHMLESLSENYGFAGEGAVIYNGRDPSLFAPASKLDYVLTAARLWDPGKNVAALRAAADDIPWPVYVAGDTKHPNGHALDTGRLQPLGRLSGQEVASWMARACIFALPALYEPFGLAALEAALCGCALVLGAIPSLREIWGDRAIWVDPHNPRDVAYGVNRLIGDPALRREMATRAQHRAAELTSDVMADEYVNAYSISRRSRACAS